MHPTPGTIFAARTDPALRLLVEDVSAPEPDGFFLVSVVPAAEAGDPLADAQEFTSDEWAALVESHGLTPE